MAVEGQYPVDLTPSLPINRDKFSKGERKKEKEEFFNYRHCRVVRNIWGVNDFLLLNGTENHSCISDKGGVNDFIFYAKQEFCF